MTGLSQRQRDIVICLCLALVTAAVYWPVQRFDFITFDDEPYITQNPRLRDGFTMRGLAWASSTSLDLWMPVTWLARLLEYQLFGLNPAPHHVVNVVFHIINTLLLFGLLKRMTGSPWRSALVAGLFTLHPLHVESVAWVTGLKDVLSMFFGLLTIWAYARYVELLNAEHRTSNSELRTPSPPPAPIAHRPSPIAFYSLTLLLFTLALMSKPMMVTLPFVLLLLDYWPLGRTQWVRAASGKWGGIPVTQLLREKVPLFLMSATSCAVTYWAQRSQGAVMSLERLPLDVRVANALLAYVSYIGKMLWPANLAVFYPVNASPSLTATMAAGVGLVVVTAMVMRWARREPWLAMGWFWYLGTLAPVIGLVQVGVVQGMANRYTYVPLVGLFIMVCWSVPAHAVAQWHWKVILSVAAMAALVICAVLTKIEIGYWKDTEMLFQRALNVTSGNWLAHNNLGSASLKQGRVQEAIEHWELALQFKPDSPEAHNNLGSALVGLGRQQEAMGHWKQALRFKPNFAEAHNNLGSALLSLGNIAEAIAHYEEALRINPDLAPVHYNLGNVFFRAGRVEKAIRQYTEAVRIDPDYAAAHNNLGFALEQMGRVQEAMEHYEQALRAKPDFVSAQSRLAALRGRPRSGTGVSPVQ